MNIDTEITVEDIKRLIKDVTENLHHVYSKLMLFEHVVKVANQRANTYSLGEEKNKMIYLAVYAGKKAKQYEDVLIGEGLRLADAERLLDEKLKSK